MYQLIVLGLGIVLAAFSGKALASERSDKGGANNGVIQLAQLQLNFGVPDGLVFRTLRQHGFTDIEIFSRKLTKVRATACKNGRKFKVEISVDGQIRSQTPVGDCRKRIDEASARIILQKRGYRKILLERTDGGFLGTACTARNRFRIIVDDFGGFRQLGAVGRCDQRAPKPVVRDRLLALGYTRINFIDRALPAYVVHACLDAMKVELRLTNDGNIHNVQRIGQCEPPIDPARIADVLGSAGLTRVVVTDDQLPRYQAQACRGTVRVEVALDRYGTIHGERAIGQCPGRLTRDQLAMRLRSEGYRNIKFVDGVTQAHLVEVCDDKQRYQISFTLYGDTQYERVLGPCRSPRIRKIISDMEERGMSRVNIFAEGCRKGKRIRLELDRYGSTLNARRIGNCR